MCWSRLIITYSMKSYHSILSKLLIGYLINALSNNWQLVTYILTRWNGYTHSSLVTHSRFLLMAHSPHVLEFILGQYKDYLLGHASLTFLLILLCLNLNLLLGLSSMISRWLVKQMTCQRTMSNMIFAPWVHGQQQVK